MKCVSGNFFKKKQNLFFETQITERRIVFARSIHPGDKAIEAGRPSTPYKEEPVVEDCKFDIRNRRGTFCRSQEPPDCCPALHNLAAHRLHSCRQPFLRNQYVTLEATISPALCSNVSRNTRTRKPEEMQGYTQADNKTTSESVKKESREVLKTRQIHICPGTVRDTDLRMTSLGGW